jgi:hypothetical protein
MLLAMWFTHSHLRVHLLQRRQLICFQVTQLFSSRPIHGRLLLVLHKHSTLWLPEAVLAAVLTLAAAVAEADI